MGKGHCSKHSEQAVEPVSVCDALQVQVLTQCITATITSVSSKESVLDMALACSQMDSC